MGLVAITVAAIGGGTSLPALADSTSPPTGGVTIMSGSSTQSRGGLTCHNQWFNTLGKTNCVGHGRQKWRLKLTCQLQGDIYGNWQYGPGSDQNECTFRVTGASINWG
ncbi:hypothetical protein MUY14_29280 [Amycolatopsis sp. FBCC-B4732]|uniref:hypothetical protein n=1 Tax=Amycolatopsis sp. FBCC-B4732 TaxID=3079339 RepID=UPI001FF30BDA|nr:hypothetical protein [Amycolatopsis sp. FBCC-B4732]UOX85857.1 hypothetical protein MUY14_29280 [Amycolatopsis sp. FBCC-B4732]